MSAYFALAGDVSAIQLVNQAQIDYVKNFIATSTDATLASYKAIVASVLVAMKFFT
eukprot:gene3625-4292_t